MTEAAGRLSLNFRTLNFEVEIANLLALRKE